MFECKPIGIIHSPFTDLSGMPIQPTGANKISGTIEVYEQYREGLQDIDGFSHLILLYHFHQSKGFNLRVVPFLDTVERGLFSTRAPKRPNPIGLSVVELDRLEDNVLFIKNVDVLDGTPLIDIKPYVPSFDQHNNTRIGWLENTCEAVVSKKSDQRFRT